MVGASVVLGAAASLVVTPMSVINIYALAAALSMVFVLVWNVGRLVRPVLP
jgi:hypothetical protein